MARQLNFLSGNLAQQARQPLEGFRYQSQLLNTNEENALLAHVRELPFKNFEFHGHQGKRRTVSFGWHYEFAGRGKLRKADDIPQFLLPLRNRAAAFSALQPDALQHVLVIEYGPGAGIGWHRDKPVFGDVIGVSLLAPCVLRFRRKTQAGTWKRVNVCAEPRSAYLLTGAARLDWEHSILGVDQLRYSITFRTIAAEK